MPRPTPAQISYGTLAVVATTVVLLAVSGADSVLSIAVLVVFALALGTLATTLSITGRPQPAVRAEPRRRGRSAPAADAGHPAQPQRVP